MMTRTALTGTLGAAASVMAVAASGSDTGGDGSDKHAPIEVSDIAVTSPDPVDEMLITCEQTKPMKMKHRYAIKDGKAWLFDIFSREPVDPCFRETGECAAGWHAGDAVFLRQFSSGGRQITRIDLDALTMNVRTELSISEPILTRWDCTARPLPAPR